MKGVDPISLRSSFPELLQLRTETQAPPARRIFSQSASAAAREGAGARTASMERSRGWARDRRMTMGSILPIIAGIAALGAV